MNQLNKQNIKTNQHTFFEWGMLFPKQLGLDSNKYVLWTNTSDSPSKVAYIFKLSEVYRSKSRSTYLRIRFSISFCYSERSYAAWGSFCIFGKRSHAAWGSFCVLPERSHAAWRSWAMFVTLIFIGVDLL